jgi:hypothetical protein
MNDKLSTRIAKAIQLANEALARYHAKRDEARTEGWFSDEVGSSDMAEYGKQIAIASELSELRAEIEAEEKEYE